MSGSRSVPFDVPGSQHRLYFHYTKEGRLTRITCATRVYVTTGDRGVRTYGDDLCTMREVRRADGFVRHVHAGAASWMEEYAWDDIGRPVRVDGVEIVRDDERRVTLCRDDDGSEWRYGYADDDLAVIDAPFGLRHLTRGVDGRPLLWREGSEAVAIRYRDDDVREDAAPLPRGWNRDELGRLWTIAGADGRIITTFLWDGIACFGRIDGDVGDPLAAVFSLDPSFTPVRVITPGGFTRIPRDAFGENLLAHRGVPGLYGGAVHDGLFHFRSRALDPRCGSFDRRDPWDGMPDDPRRADGFRGMLPVEEPACGPYAVSQYDPVGRIDPTGEASALTALWILLDLTWSLPNNVFGFFGFDWTVGFWSSLFVAPLQIRGESAIKRFFDFEGLSNERTGEYALRRGTWGIGRAFTFQHIVMSDHEQFEDLQQINVIDPGGPFTPLMYGTILRVDVSGVTNPVLLRGNLDGALGGWTRSGGPAVAVAPGSDVPRFPSGGIHLDNMLVKVLTPKTCNVAELTPSGLPVTGTVADAVPAFELPAGAALAVGAVVFLTDGTGAADIKTVNDISGTHVRFLEPGLAVATTGVSLSGLTGGTAETLNILASIASGDRFNISAGTGSTAPYVVGDPLKLMQGGAIVAAEQITALEAQLNIDGALPALGTSLSVNTGSAVGALTACTIDPATGNFASGTTPGQNDLIALIDSGGVTIGAVVVDPSDPTKVKLDRTVAVLAALVAPIQWRPVNQGGLIGTAPAVDLAATLTYQPLAVHTAPSTDFVIVKGAAPNPAVRSVTALNYEAIVVGKKITGATGSPYQVTRFAFGPPTLTALALSIDTSITVPAGTTFPGASVLQLTQLPSNTLTPGSPGSAVACSVSGTAVTFAPANPPNVLPSQLCVLQAGTTLEAHVATRITAVITIDRSITFNATALIDAIAVTTTGFQQPIYNAIWISGLTLVALPTTGGGGGTSVQMPRFAAGNLVQVTSGAAPPQQYVVGSVTGTTLTLIEPPTAGSVPQPPVGGTFTVQLVMPAAGNPPTDTFRVGLLGLPTGGAASGGNITTNTISIDIWNAAHVSNGTVLALVQGTTTHIAVVAAAPSYTVTLLGASAIAGAATMTTFAGATAYSGSFTQTGVDLKLNDLGLPAGNPLFAVVPYTAAAGAAALTGVSMSSGTIRIPDDAEKWEIDRRKSLTFHELTHTRQAQLAGPVFLAMLPIFVFEIFDDIFSDAELPPFSQYVAATIETDKGLFFLKFDDMQGVPFDTGSKVQIVQSQNVSFATVGAKDADANRFQLTGSTSSTLNAGGVQVRRQVRDDGLTKFRDGIFNIFHVWTMGGVANLAAGATWGNLIFWVKKLIYIIAHRVFHSGDGYAAKVVDATTVQMNDDDGKRAVLGFNSVYVVGQQETKLFDVDSISEGKLTLRQQTTNTGDVQVKPYKTDLLVDWLDYWDANVTDPDKPSQITIKKNKDGKPLKLDPFDIVSIGSGVTAQRTNVTAVISEDVVELEAQPVTDGPDRALRIAFIDEKDPLGTADAALLTTYGLGWMRWLFDPYRQFEFGLDPTRRSWKDWLARIARYLFSSHSWSLLPFGYAFWDDLRHGSTGGRFSNMEQEASEESGNVYSTICRIQGGFEDDDFGKKKGKVGEIARYWYTPDWGNPGDQYVINKTQFDSPGVSVQNRVVVVPTGVVPSPATAPLNGGIAASSARPDSFLPDVFYPKGTAVVPNTPTSLFGRTPLGWQPGLRGIIPLTPTLEISFGAYVAFTQPGTHRVTVDDSIVGSANARDVQDAEKQTTFFDVTISDLDVQFAGSALPQTPATPPSMIITQKAVVTVTDAAGASFALTVTQPGAVLTPAADGSSISAVTVGTESVELTRVYRTTGGTYSEEVLSAYSTYLPVDIHIPIRAFTVNVVNTFTLLASPSPDAAAVTAPAPGTSAFILIPANVLSAPAVTNVAYPALGSALQPLTDPVIVPNLIATPDAIKTFIDIGKVFQVDFRTDDPPEEIATLTFTASVGAAASPQTITATAAYTPAFQLFAAGGSYTVAKGSSITLNTVPPTQLEGVIISGDITGITATITGGTSIKIDVAMNAGSAKHRVVATSTGPPPLTGVRTIQIP
jgi:large repetitive protein